MNKKLENISLGMATLFVLSIVGLIGSGFFYVETNRIIEIGIAAIISAIIISTVGIISIIVSLMFLHTIGDIINKRYLGSN